MMITELEWLESESRMVGKPKTEVQRVCRHGEQLKIMLEDEKLKQAEIFISTAYEYEQNTADARDLTITCMH